MSGWCSCNPLREAQEKAAKWDAIVRCKECKHYEPEYSWEEFREVGHPYETCWEPPTCTLGYALSGVARDTIPDGFCSCKRAEIIRLLACDLCDRAKEHEKARKSESGLMWAGFSFGKGEGIGKTQLHADIVQLRRMLALLDKEIQK